VPHSLYKVATPIPSFTVSSRDFLLAIVEYYSSKFFCISPAAKVFHASFYSSISCARQLLNTLTSWITRM
jgi:hypothetical protein